EDLSKKIRIYLHRYGGMKTACGTRQLRLAYSLNEDNGLVSLPLTSEELPCFRPWQAHLHNNVTVDKPWHGDVPSGAWRKTLRFLRAVDNDTKPQKQIRFGLNILPTTHPNSAGQTAAVVGRASLTHTRSRDGGQCPTDTAVTSHPGNGADSSGYTENATGTWMAALKSKKESKRIQAAWHLMTSQEAMPFSILEAGLSDENPDVRWYLTEALQKHLGPEARNLVTKMLSDPDQFVRISASDALMLANAEPSHLLPDLLSQWRDSTDPLNDLMYVVEKQIMRAIEETETADGPQIRASALAAAGQKVLQVVESISSTYPKMPVKRWITQIRGVCSAYRIEPASLFLSTIRLCIQKLVRDTDETEIELQPYASVLREIYRGEALPFLTIHAIANALSIHDLEIPTTRRVAKVRARLQPVIETILASSSMQEKMRMLSRLVLHGSPRLGDVGTKLLMKMGRSESTRAIIQNIGSNAWLGYVDRLRQTESHLEQAIAAQIEAGNQVVSQFSQTLTTEAMINSLRAVASLIARLGDQRWQIQRSTEKALPWIDKPTPDIIPVLLEMLKDEDEQVRRRAVNALGNVGSPAAIPALIDTLGDASKSVRSHAIFALSQIGRPTVDQLIQALHANDRRIPSHAALVLGKIGDPAAVPALIEVLDNPSMTFNVTRALADIGAPAAIPALIEQSRTEDRDRRHMAAEVLRRIRAHWSRISLEPSQKDRDTREV
ncbi:MAG: HEAT repeat domain-containing protein, partial [Candidatus Poribacteria bacterium]|nr:HEAT repeat domain-containing protein [Candidatus Poribacteria bacterium]